MLRKLSSRVVVWMGMSCLIAGLLAAPAWADGNEREIDQARKRVQEMLREAEELQDLGKHDRARELITKAEELQQKINAALKREKKSKDRAQGEKSWDGILRGLRNGVEALVALGKHEEAERLEKIAAAVRQRLEHSRKMKNEESERRAHAELKESEAANKERDILKRRLEIMGLASKALQEAERKNEHELLERGMHAYELRLKGRRDKEALHVYENMPDNEQLAEVMIYAGKLWHEFGHPDKGDLCHEVGRSFVGKKAHRERRERDGHREREGRREREHERERSRDLLERIEQLQERMAHLEDMIKKLQNSLREVKDR